MSNSKLKNKTVEPSVQEVQCPVSGIYFSSIGVDVHAQILVCHSQRYDPDSKSLFESDVRFGTSRQQLELFAQWIIEKDPEVVLMESTGVYWFSPYEALEQAGFNTDSIKVVKATEVKAAKGRKTDKVDAKRLSEFARMGSFHNSFIPTKAEKPVKLAVHCIRPPKIAPVIPTDSISYSVHPEAVSPVCFPILMGRQLPRSLRPIWIKNGRNLSVLSGN